MEPRLVQKLKLLMQGRDVAMIPAGETPILDLSTTTKEEALRLVSVTVRFLRCGCPSVQWLISHDGFGDSGDQQTEVVDIVHDTLCNLEVRGENFEIDSPELWKQGTVITITRTVAPNIVETTFGEIQEDGVILEEKRRGTS